MKTLLIPLVAVTLLLLSCEKKEQPLRPEDQAISCKITAPEHESRIYIDDIESFTISGEGSVQAGSIAEVKLTVNDKVIEDVKEVPFSYEYDVRDAEDGESLKIRLDVTGSAGAKKYSAVRVMLKKSFKPEYGSIVDERDGQNYKTVKIGKQVWMAENLRYLPRQDFDISWTEPRYYIWFDFDLNDADEMNRKVARKALEIYGAFYNWHAAVNGEAANNEGENRPVHGICPNGWHIPSQVEWKALHDFVVSENLTAKDAEGKNDSSAVAKALAIQGDDNMWMLPPDLEEEPQPTWPGVNKELNNATGFSAIGIGFRACAGTDIWMQSAFSGCWWSSTRSSNLSGTYHPAKIWADTKEFKFDLDFNPGVGTTVRCLKD